MKVAISLKKFLLLLLLPFITFSCAEVMLIGAYDTNIDEGIQSIAKQTSTLQVKMEQNVDDGKEWTYTVFEDDYVGIKSELKTLVIRANALPKYEIIKKQLGLLESSIDLLEKDHKSGFVAPGVTDKALIKKSMATDFSAIEASLSAMLKLQEGLKRTKVDKA